MDEKEWSAARLRHFGDIFDQHCQWNLSVEK